jgi:hypothetical protein
MNGSSVNPKQITSIHIVHGGDHGKEKFLFCSKLLLYKDNGDCHSEVFGLADVKCCKDHAQIVDHTCMPEMMKGVNLIKRSQIVFSQESYGNNKTKMILSLREDANEQQSNDGTICRTIKLVSFVAGDLAFLVYLMEKDNFSLAWCNWGKNPSSVWKVASNTNGDRGPDGRDSVLI